METWVGLGLLAPTAATQLPAQRPVPLPLRPPPLPKPIRSPQVQTPPLPLRPPCPSQVDKYSSVIKKSANTKPKVPCRFCLSVPHSQRCSRPPRCCHRDRICCCVASHRGDCLLGAIPCHSRPDYATAASSLASQCGPAHCSHTCLPTRHGAAFPGAFARHAHPSAR